jgi:hypothetical protein
MQKNRLSIFLTITFQVLFISPPVIGAVYTSSQTGAWSDTLTWGGAGVPGNGDRCIIKHNVLLSGSVTVGDSPVTYDAPATTTNPAVDIALDASLTLAANALLISRGDIKCFGVITMGAGAVVELDSSQAASPSTTSYRLCLETTGNRRLDTYMTINGTSAKHCQIRSNAGGANGRMLASYYTETWPYNVGTESGGRVVADYCDFSNLGDASNAAWHFRSDTSGAVFRLSDCTFTGCGELYQNYQAASGASVIIERCKWTSSTALFDGGFGDSYIFRFQAATGATCRLSNNYFDKKALLFYNDAAVIEDNAFDNGIWAQSGSWQSFTRNFVRWQYSSSINSPYGAPSVDNLFIMDYSEWNPHYIQVQGGTGETLFSGNIFWFTTPNGMSTAEGDGILVGNPASGTRADNHIILERNIVLPNGNGPDGTDNLTCTLFTILYDSSLKRVTARRNTVFTNGIGGCNIGETQIARSGNVDYCKSNLFIGDTTNTGYKMRNLGNAETDVVLAADADYNGSYRCSASSGGNIGAGAGKGYRDFTFSGGMDIGANDIDNVNPQFIDWTRTPVTWDTSLGGPGTLDSAAQQLAPGGGHTVQEMLDYVRGGFRPQNSACHAAGDPADGSPDLGAVDMATGDTTPPGIAFNSVIVTGTAKDDSGSVIVTVNGVSVSPSFSTEVEVAPPATIIVEAADASSNVRDVVLEIM